MAAPAIADFQPETTTAVTVKRKEALMDAMEDILFGSVRSPSPHLPPQNNFIPNPLPLPQPSLTTPDRRRSRKVHRIPLRHHKSASPILPSNPVPRAPRLLPPIPRPRRLPLHLPRHLRPPRRRSFRNLLPILLGACWSRSPLQIDFILKGEAFAAERIMVNRRYKRGVYKSGVNTS
jgi:hypothetical protein